MYLVYALPGGERLAEGRASSEQSRASTIIHHPPAPGCWVEVLV